MTIEAWLNRACKELQAVDIATARLDCLVLLGDELAHDKAWTLAHLDSTLSLAASKRLETKLRQRLDHQPLAYIRGKTEFYGREFMLTPSVLEPRPESEAMIELLEKLDKPFSSLVDVGTGSGALGITAKLEYPKLNVTLIDIDARCLLVARGNAKLFQVDVQLIESDLLTEFVDEADVLLANLPYVPNYYQLNRAALNEPRTAIFGGPDGLDMYRKLFAQLKNYRNPPAFVFTESLPPAHQEITQMANSANYRLLMEQDFIQVFGLRRS
jgi:release factor glutamine methyltransferase